MPSLIGSVGIDGTTATGVAANYLKTIPSWNFGTRNINFYKVAIANLDVDYALANSDFSKAVKGIQVAAEVWYVSTPASGACIVGIASETAQDSGSDGDTSPTVLERLKTVVDAATAKSSTITDATFA